MQTEQTETAPTPNVVMEETGHPTMLARVKAFHKMLTALTDEWEEFQYRLLDNSEARPPKWIKNNSDNKFFSDMRLLFDSSNLEDISITKKQHFYMKDIYDRSL